MGSLFALKTLASSAQLHSYLANRPPFLLLSVELSGSLESDFVSAAKVQISNWVRSTDRPRDLRGSSSSGPRGFHLVPACSMVGANLNEKKKKYTKSTLPSKICVVCNKPMTWWVGICLHVFQYSQTCGSSVSECGNQCFIVNVVVMDIDLSFATAGYMGASNISPPEHFIMKQVIRPSPLGCRPRV